MGAQNSPNTPYQNMIIVTFSHDIHMHFVKSDFWVDYLNLATTNYNNLGAPASPSGGRAVAARLPPRKPTGSNRPLHPCLSGRQAWHKTKDKLPGVFPKNLPFISALAMQTFLAENFVARSLLIPS